MEASERRDILRKTAAIGLMSVGVVLTPLFMVGAYLSTLVGVPPDGMVELVLTIVILGLFCIIPVLWVPAGWSLWKSNGPRCVLYVALSLAAFVAIFGFAEVLECVAHRLTH